MVRASVPKITLDQVFETKEEIAHAVKEELEKVRNEESKPEFLTIRTGYGRIWLRHHSNSYYRHYPGYKCQKGWWSSSSFRGIELTALQAMNEINAAERRRVAAQDKAEAEKIRIVKVLNAFCSLQQLNL